MLNNINLHDPDKILSPPPPPYLFSHSKKRIETPKVCFVCVCYDFFCCVTAIRETEKSRKFSMYFFLLRYINVYIFTPVDHIIFGTQFDFTFGRLGRGSEDCRNVDCVCFWHIFEHLVR